MRRKEVFRITAHESHYSSVPNKRTSPNKHTGWNFDKKKKNKRIGWNFDQNT